MSDFLFRFREPLSAAGSAMIMLLLPLLFHSLAPPLRKPATSFAPIELTFSVPEVRQPSEQPVIQPSLMESPAMPRSVAQAVAPRQEPITASKIVVAPAAAAMPVLATPTVQVAPAVPGQANQLVVSPAPPVDSGRADSRLNAEAIYVGKVRAYLQTIKRYPTGREASLQRPSGTSVIWFVVRRNGELVEAGIQSSSGSMLLDNAALATVRRSIYPVFPDEAWSGKAQQHFTVELDFIPAH